MKKLKTLLLILASLFIVSCGCSNLIDDYEESINEDTEIIVSTEKKSSIKEDQVIEIEDNDEDETSTLIEETNTDTNETEINEETETDEIEVNIVEKEVELEETNTDTNETEINEETETDEIIETEITEFDDEKYKIDDFELLYIIKDCECDVRTINYNITHDNQSCYVNKRSHTDSIESIKIRYCYLGTEGYNECDIYIYHIDNNVAIYHWKYDNSKTIISSATFENDVLIINTISD